MTRIKERVWYQLDPHNRLVVSPSGKKSKIPKYRHVAEGRFKLNKSGRLFYHVKRSQGINIPQQIKFSGSFSLNKSSNLVLTLNKWNNQIAGNKLTIKGSIASVNKRSLLFTVTTKTLDNRTHIYTLKLLGSWSVDRFNRLLFKVEKQKRPSEILILEGTWQINKRSQLIYIYTKTKRTLIFKGRFKMANNFTLSYMLEGTKKSPITIFGRWKIDKRRGIIFEVRYRKNRVSAIIFGADIKLKKHNILELRLKNTVGKDLGLELKISKRLLKGAGEAFIKALASKKEVTINAGTGFRW